MVDLHMHILPGLDDGASSMEESIRMARQAAAGGVNYIAASSSPSFPQHSTFPRPSMLAGLNVGFEIPAFLCLV